MLKFFPSVVTYEHPVRLRLPGRYFGKDLEDYYQDPQAGSGYIQLRHRRILNLCFITDMIDSVVEFPLKDFNEDMIKAILKLGVHPDSPFLLVGYTFEVLAHPRAMTLQQILETVQSA